MGVFILKQFLVCMRTYQEGQVPTLPAISCGYHLAWKVLRVTLRAGSVVQCPLWVLTLRDSHLQWTSVSLVFHGSKDS